MEDNFLFPFHQFFCVQTNPKFHWEKNCLCHRYIRKWTLCLRWGVICFQQAFEDEAEGIVCYTDENGEMICEGYDEGPRFSHISRTNFQSR